MLIDDRGFELGIPTLEEMLRHMVVLLKHEREDAWLRLVKANEDIQHLIEINERLNREIAHLRRQLQAQRVERVVEQMSHAHPGHVPSWGVIGPSTEEILAEIERERNIAKAP